ncbi:MAG: integron integrase [Candidatus Hadarchaeum sp.]
MLSCLRSGSVLYSIHTKGCQSENHGMVGGRSCVIDSNMGLCELRCCLGEDMNTLSLEPFEAYLAKRQLVPERQRPYLVRWVRLFLQGPGGDKGLSPADQKKLFQDALDKDRRLEDWQRRQAMQAVELYLDQFLPWSRAKTLEKDLFREMEGKEFRVSHPGEAGRSLNVQRMRELLRIRHYSYRTEQSYLHWVERYHAFCQSRGLHSGDADSVRSFLSYLAIGRNVASSTQNQAFNALLFYFREVLGKEFGEVKSVRAKKGPRLPVVLSEEETRRVLAQTEGTTGLILRLIYGSGLRVSEAVRLRVKDLDFDLGLLIVREAKGDKDRVTVLAQVLIPELKEHLRKVKALHEEDLRLGYGEVYLPYALAVKYPNAGRDWAWQYVFPAKSLSVDPRSGEVRRHHVGDRIVQMAMRQAVARAGIPKPASVHTLRHSFATHLLMKGVNIREVQRLLGHKSVESTMVYLHVIRNLQSIPVSPLDTLGLEGESQ